MEEWQQKRGSISDDKPGNCDHQERKLSWTGRSPYLLKSGVERYWISKAQG